MEKQILQDYFNDLSKLLSFDDEILDKIVEIKSKIITTNENGGKILIFGNGGSAAIASHFSVDLTKNAKVRSVNFNEADLITCFANDFGFENWIAEAINFYADKQDSVIFISSSGKSQNMVLGAEKAIQSNLNSIITFTGFEKDNLLSSKGDINVWIDSKAYNFVENIHQVILLSIVDLIIGDRHYEA